MANPYLQQKKPQSAVNEIDWDSGTITPPASVDGIDWESGAITPPPQEPGLVARVKQGASRAIDSARTALTDDPNKIAQIASDQARTALPQTETQRKMAEEIAPYVDAANKAQGVVDNVKTWGAAGIKRAGQLLSNPGEAAKMVAEQLPNSLPGMAGGIAGAKLGAMAGTAVAPGVGTLVGGVLGGVAGGFAGGYGLEKGAAMQEQVQKEARAQQIDLQDQPAVAKMVALKQAEFDAAAQRKGVGTAGTDALLNVATMGLAGVGGRTLAKEARTLADAVKAGTISAADAGTTLAQLEAKNAARNTLGAKALRGTGVVGAEMAGEGLSEAAGQKLAYGKVDAGDVIDEALLGLGTGGAMALGSKAFNKAAGIVDQDGTTRDIAAARDGLGELEALDELGGLEGQELAAPPATEPMPAPILDESVLEAAGVRPPAYINSRNMDRMLGELPVAQEVDAETASPEPDMRPPSERMGINPAAGPLSRVAAVAVDSGASPVEFLGATGRDLQARATGPGVTNESNVIDVQGRVVEDRAIATPRRLVDDRGAMAAEAGRGTPPAAPAALPSPTNLREAVARVRAQKQEAANAQAAAQRATPAAQALPGPGAVESDSTRTAGIAAEFPTVQGSTNGPQADQAVQAIPQPAQAGAAPAAEPATSDAGTPATAGAPEVRALTDGAQASDTGAQAAPAEGAQAAPVAAPEFTTVKTIDGGSVTVRTADLNGDKPKLRQYTKAGKAKAVPAIHRDNLDPAGEKRAAVATEDAANPLFNVITTKSGKPFAIQSAAERELKRLAMGATHEVVRADAVQGGGRGFVIRRKEAASQPDDMQPFAAETGTLGIPRAEMPQVPAQSHGALVKHLNAQGIEHETTMVEAADLKPTQAEYSPAKVAQAKEAAGDRAVIVSNDGHIIDGHHQALAAAEEGAQVKAIVLDAPVEQALEAVKNSPSAQADAVQARDTKKGPDQVPASSGLRLSRGKRAPVEANVSLSKDKARFSRSPDTKSAYDARIDALFSGDKPRLKGAKVLDRSDMLAFLGLGDGPVNLAESKVIAGQSNHPRMTAAVWKQIPEWLENPAFVFESDTVPGRLVFIAPELVNGSPVRIVVEPGAAGGVNAHLLMNAYDAQSNVFRRWETAGLLRYVDRNKYARVSGTFQPQLTGLPGERGRAMILTDKQYNGWRRANSPSFDREPQAGMSPEQAVAALYAEGPAPTADSNARLVATQMLVDGLVQNWTRAPEIIVARNMQDRAIPQAVRDYDQTLKSQGATGEPRGFIYKGKVYLLADELRGPQQIAEVLFHEALGHFGLRGAFGDSLKPILQQMGTMRRRDVVAKAREYGMVSKGMNDADTWAAMSAQDRLSAAEEVLAEMAQSTPEIGFVQRAIAAIRTWLRANVPGFKQLALTDAEIVRSYILPARGFVTRSSETPQQSLERAMMAFSRGGSDAEAALRELAAEAQAPGNANKTVVLGPVSPQQLELLQREGVPVDGGFTHAADMFAVRHALNRHGDAAVEAKQGQLPLGEADIAAVPKIIASADALILGAKTPRGQDIVGSLKRMPDGNVLYLEEVRSGRKTLAMTSMRKYPGTTDFETIKDRIVPSYARSDTGDVRIVYPEDGPGQGPDDTRINFSRTKLDEMKAGAMDRINQALTFPGKVSMWDKTVGTMRHLGERAPAFKPVFEAAQRFIDDVSTLANEAADEAPRLLPRVETLADLKKKPITAEDNKAIAKPIFEGTLMWGRDADGKAVLVDDLAKKYANLPAAQKAQMLLATDQIQPGTLKMWQGLPLDQYETLVNSRFESKMLKAGVVWTDAELQSLFKATPEQISLYREARAAIDRSIDLTARADMLRAMGPNYSAMRDAVMEAPTLRDAMGLATEVLQQDARSNPDDSDRLMAINNQVVSRFEDATALQESGYAPLSRFGRYTVDVVDTAGERQYFGMFEDMAEANKMAAKMRSAFPGAAVTSGTMSQEAYKLFAGITPESLELFGNMLGLQSDGADARDKAFQEYLALAKNNHSALKRLIHRQGIAGYSEDVGRVLASFVYSNARQAAGGLNAGTMETAINNIPKEQGELKDVAMGLQSYISDPQEEGQAIRGMLFAQYLGGSLASAFVNMTQPFAVTMPYLSQFGGMKKAAAQMARAVREVGAKTFKGEPDLEIALQRAVEDGTVAPQEIQQLMAQARGTGSLRVGDGTKVGNARAAAANNWERVKVAWGQPFALAEQFNRRTTFIAAFRLAKAQGNANPADFARKAVLETQFLYSKANKARWARGAVGGTLMTFKTYSVSYLELLQRTWNAGAPGSPERAAGRRAVAWALVMLVLMGGAGGLPFVEDLEDLIDGAGQLMGYNVSAKQWRKQLLADVLGKELGDFVNTGVSGLPGAPIDVSGRLGMGNLIPGTGLFLTKQNRERDLLEVAGPAGDLVARGFTGARKALTGDLTGAALELSPSAVRNAAKGIDMAASGIYKDTKGYKVLDTTLPEAAAKFIGFQPRSVAQVQEANSFMLRSKAFYTQTSSEIKAQWARALFEKDEAALQQVRERLDAWNRDNPEQRISVQMPDVWKRVREMGKDRTQRIADTAPKALREQMRQEVQRTREAP